MASLNKKTDTKSHLLLDGCHWLSGWFLLPNSLCLLIVNQNKVDVLSTTQDSIWHACKTKNTEHNAHIFLEDCHWLPLFVLLEIQKPASIIVNSNFEGFETSRAG